jgi:hypothetical protein
MPRKLGDLVLYSVDDLHEHLGISKMTIRAYLREGKLKGRKFGVSWFVTQDALNAFFNEEETDLDDSFDEQPHNRELVQQEAVQDFEPVNPYSYIIQGINDLVSESDECETAEEVIAVLEEQPIISLLQVSTIRKKDGKLIEVLKAREFIEKYS